MAEKSNVKPSTMWSSKPVKMKLFGAWEIDKTPPDCIPRLCSLNINRLSWTPSMRQDVTAIIVAVKMQNSKRILRSNEIAIALPSHTSDSPASADIELDLSFTLQYPHFLKRNCNYLQIILQRRKKYKNKAILGFKTLACGVIDMAEVLQRSTIVEKDIDLIGHVKESGKNENLARITISTLRSQPIDQDSNLRRGKVSIDRPDVYSDEDDFTSAEDGSDSETIEEGNARDRMNHFRRKVNSRKPRKLFSGNDKFQSGVPSNVQQRNLKQKFISLLKKFRLPDSEGVYDSEEKFQEALEKELMSSNQEPADIDEYFDDDDIDELDYMSDSGQEFDDVSISSTPKPSLRPFFSSCTLVGQDKPEEQFPAFQGKKPFDNDSQENSGAEQTPDTSDTSQKHTEPQEPVSLKKSEETKKKAVNDKEVKRVKLFPTAKDKENKSQPKERKQPVSNSLSLTSASMSKDDSSPKEFILEQLNKVFSSDEHNIPDEILFINMAECAQAALLMAVFERTHHIIGTNTLSDVKFSFTFLCNKIQKFCNSNLKTPIPIKLALIGSEAYVNSFLRIYVDLLSSKSPDWQTYLRFYLIPASFINSSSPASSSPLHKYLASIDPAYAGYFHTSKDSVESSRDAGGSSEAAAASSAGAVAGSSGGAGGSLVSVQELYSKVVNYLNGAQTLLQIPIAEAMVTYKDKTGEDEPSQVFIPFISDAKIGLLDSIYGNHSMDNDDATFVVGGTPSQTTGAANAATSEKSVTSPLSTKDQHASMSLTPPNSPSISSNQTFLSQTGSGGKADKEREHKEKEKEKEKDKEKEKEKEKEKDALASEAIDLQIDYWTVQQKLNDLSNKEAKKSDNCKFTLKNCFRNLQISRLPMLGEQSISSLTLFYVLKEKKKQIMRLGKKKEKENESKCQVVEGICRLVCSYKATQSPIKVNIDGVELTGVKFFQLTTQWQTQIKFFPLVIFSTPDSFAVNSSPFGNSSNNYKMLKLLHSYLLLINLINKMAKLSDDEIINFMKDMLSYTVKREQLSSPNRQLVIEIYAQFLQELDFDVNSITQRDFMACGDMTNVEAMDGILVPIHIYTIVQQCVVHYGIHDMNLMDILSPKRSRTNRIISALCFFFLRYSAVKKEWLRLKNEGLAIRTEILQLKQKDQELKHLIEEKSMLFTSLNNNSEAMEKEKNALIEENKKKKRESDEKSEQFKLTKTEILKLEDRLCSVNIEISKGKEEIKQLEELIIKSPQKSIQITADMERALMELKKEVPEKKQQLMTINKMIDCYKAVLTYLKPSTGDISNLLIMLSSTDKECENLENIKQDTLSLREEIKSIKIKMSECQKAKQGWQTKINNWARQHQRIFGQLEGLNNGLQESKKKKSEDIAKLQGQKQWVEKALKQLQNTNDNLDKDFQEIEKRYTDTISKYKEELIKRF